MFCQIDSYQLTDGTIEGGIALSGLRIRFERIFDSVIALDESSPVFFFRGVHKSTIEFNVTRNHGTAKDAENFILSHDDSIPATGTVQLISSDGTVQATIQNALIFFQQLNSEIGSTTIHAYRIEGGPFAPVVVPPETDHIVTEDGEDIITEDGQAITTE